MGDITTRITDFYVPTHALAGELVERMKHEDIEAIALMGRTHEDVGCIKVDLIQQLRAMGVHEGPVACATRLDNELVRCPQYDVCGYIQQFRDASHTPVIVRTHGALVTPESLPEALYLKGRSPVLNIVDENPIGEMIELGTYRPDEMLAAADELNAPVLKELMRLVEDGTDPVAQWRDNPDKREALNEALDAMTIEMPHFLPSDGPEYSLTQLERWTPSPRPPYEVVDILLTALRRHEGRCNGLWLGTRGELRFARLRSPMRFSINDSMACLDASADPVILDRLFPNLKIHEAKVAQNAYVTQVWDKSFSKSAIKKDAQYTQHIEDFIWMVESRFGSTAVITGKDHAEVLNPDWGAHYNALRGLDHLKDVNAGVVISRVQPRAWDVEAVARALFPHECMALTGEYVRRPAGYRMRSGERVGIVEFYHPDPLCNRVLLQLREAESAQGVGRLRLVHRKETAPVFVLNNLPLDLTVDRQVRWRDLVGEGGRLARGLRRTGGVLPLSADWLHAALPEIWKSKSAAANWIRRLLKSNPLLNNSESSTHSCNSESNTHSRNNIFITEVSAARFFDAFQWRLEKRHRCYKTDDRLPWAITILPALDQTRARLESLLAEVWPDDTLLTIDKEHDYE